ACAAKAPAVPRWGNKPTRIVARPVPLSTLFQDHPCWGVRVPILEFFSPLPAGERGARQRRLPESIPAPLAGGAVVDSACTPIAHLLYCPPTGRPVSFPGPPCPLAPGAGSVVRLAEPPEPARRPAYDSGGKSVVDSIAGVYVLFELEDPGRGPVTSMAITAQE